MNNGFLPRNLPLKLVMTAAAHPRSVLAGCLIVMVAAALLGLRVRIESDVLALIPEHNKVVTDFRETVERFGSTDILLLALKMDSEQDVEEYLAFADIVAGDLRKDPDIQWLEYRVQDFIEAGEILLSKVTMILGSDELETLLQQLEPDGVRRRAAVLAEKLRSPMEMGMGELIAKDPLGITAILKQRLDGADLGSRFHPDNGYLIDPGQSYLLMLMKPVEPAANIHFSRDLMGKLAKKREEWVEAWLDDGGEGEPPEIIFSGGYPVAVEDSRTIVKDMRTGILTALVGVVLLFAFAFGRKTAPLICCLPLVTGLLLTFAFVVLTVGSLNAATSTFAAMLIGLAVDFIIVLYGRYLEERAAGADHETALRTFARYTASGVLLGAVTTAATFYAFLISDFKGLSQLGLLTGTGVLISVVVVFLVLPALLTLLEKMKPGRAHQLRAFGLERLCSVSLKRPRTVIALCAVLTAVSVLGLVRVRYDDDVLSLRSGKNANSPQSVIREAFGMGFTPMLIRVDAPDEEELASRTKRLLEDLAPLVEDGDLVRVDSLYSFFPDFEQQRRNLARLSRFERDPDLIREEFEQALSEEGLSPEPFLEGIDPVLDSLGMQRPLSFASLAREGLAPLIDRYMVSGPEGAMALIYCYLSPERWRREPPPSLTQLVEAQPHALLTGPIIISLELKRIVWRDALLAALVGTVIVFIFLAWDLGGLKAGLAALLPLLVGMLWMVGIMGALDMPLNFLNLFVFTMIIGIGVDYGIHLVHRWQEREGLRLPISGTAKAIMIAALTTVMGFGTLVFSQFPGLRSMGTAAILGAVCTSITSITLLPALLSVTSVKPRSRNIGTDGSDS